VIKIIDKIIKLRRRRPRIHPIIIPIKYLNNVRIQVNQSNGRIIISTFGLNYLERKRNKNLPQYRLNASFPRR